MIAAALGWTAAALFIAAQAYLSFRTNYHRPYYYGINLLAAIMLGIASVMIASWQAVVINLFWGAASYLALRRPEAIKRFAPKSNLLQLPFILLTAAGLVTLMYDFRLGLALLGWAGVWMFCAAYLQFTGQHMRRLKYLAINVVAYGLLLPVYGLQENWPSLGLGVVWMLISLGGLINLRPSRRARENTPPPSPPTA